MADIEKTPAEVRAEKVLQIERINRHLASGLTESREEDEQAKWNLAEMRRTRNELQAEVDGMDGGILNVSRIRTIRVIGTKGY